MTDLKQLLLDGKYDEVVYTYVAHNQNEKATATIILEHLNCRFIKGNEIIISKLYKSFEKLRSEGIVKRIGRRAYKYNMEGNAK